MAGNASACSADVLGKSFLDIRSLPFSALSSKLFSQFVDHCKACRRDWMPSCLESARGVDRKPAVKLGHPVSYHLHALSFLAEPKILIRDYFKDAERIMDLSNIYIAWTKACLLVCILACSNCSHPSA